MYFLLFFSKRSFAFNTIKHNDLKRIPRVRELLDYVHQYPENHHYLFNMYSHMQW